MNVCILSTFKGSKQDWLEMIEAYKEKTKDFVFNSETGFTEDIKIVSMMNITNMKNV